MASVATMSGHCSQRSATPPPGTVISEYPRIVFQPELHHMRHHKIQELVYQLAESGQTLLDVGCGDGSLLKRFICDYEGPLHRCPLKRVDGIDVDEENFKNPYVLEEIDDALHTQRWTPMSVHIMKGSFQIFDGVEDNLWDIVVSCEVVEHLDPEPLEDFPRIVLGQMKPDLFIVTTPDRRFNRIFDILAEYQPHDIPKYERYKRPGIEYEMRHDDHRFEWTLSEFQEWANTAASTYGYSVTFDGVGGFGDDPHFSAYLAGMQDPQMRGEYFARLVEEGIHDANCTQIAIFKRLDAVEGDKVPIEPPTMRLPAKLTQNLVYQCCEKGHDFPPTPDMLWSQLAASDFREYLDPNRHDAWVNWRNPYTSEGVVWGEMGSTYTVTMSLKELFERANHQLQWMCHNDPAVFEDIVNKNWKNMDYGMHKNFRSQIFDVWPEFNDEGVTLRFEFVPSGAVWWEGVGSPPSSVGSNELNQLDEEEEGAYADYEVFERWSPEGDTDDTNEPKWDFSQEDEVGWGDE